MYVELNKPLLNINECKDLINKILNKFIENTNDIEIYIRFLDEKDSFELIGCTGLSINLDFDSKIKNCFGIEIDKKCNETDMIKTLIHELIHVKQFHLNELIEFPFKNYVIWKGSKVYIDTDYNNKEWEREAFFYEEYFYEEFFERKENVRL